MTEIRPLPTPGAPAAAGETPWYAVGLRFTCQEGCTACCTGAGGYVWVTSGEIDAIAAHLGVDRATFKRDYCDRYGARWSIKESSNGDCSFLISGKGCSIYPVRPRQCRTFPFWEECIASEEAWAQTARDCPGCNQGKLHDRQHMEAAAAVSSGRRTMLERLYAAVREIYAEADRAVADAGGTCALSGRCCDLPRRSEQRRASNLEVALLTEDRVWDVAPLLDAAEAGTLAQASCPFFQGGKCAAHAERPLACRVYSCSPAYEDSEHARILARFRRELQRLEAMFGISLEEGELREMLARRAAFPRRADPLTGKSV